MGCKLGICSIIVDNCAVKNVCYVGILNCTVGLATKVAAAFHSALGYKCIHGYRCILKKLRRSKLMWSSPLWHFFGMLNPICKAEICCIDYATNSVDPSGTFDPGIVEI